LVGQADLILCVNKKIPFANLAGRIGAFPIGSTLVAMGDEAVRGLVNAHRNGLGLLLKPISMAESTLIAEAAE
jgi:hypothetical protein